MAYDIIALKAEQLHQKHSLVLVATSQSCALGPLPCEEQWLDNCQDWVADEEARMLCQGVHLQHVAAAPGDGMPASMPAFPPVAGQHSAGSIAAADAQSFVPFEPACTASSSLEDAFSITGSIDDAMCMVLLQQADHSQQQSTLPPASFPAASPHRRGVDFDFDLTGGGALPSSSAALLMEQLAAQVQAQQLVLPIHIPLSALNQGDDSPPDCPTPFPDPPPRITSSPELAPELFAPLKGKPAAGGASPAAGGSRLNGGAGKQGATAAAARGGGSGKVSGGKQQAQQQVKPPPAAWFACDDPQTKTRYIAIQGSTTLEHWQINLQFQPVVFEDAALGVRVHRGVYEAALKLYDDLLPVVRQHLVTSPQATVCFTGHSLGGSLATVVMLLAVHRGELPPGAVAPVHTFGSPAVFCGAAAPEAGSGQDRHRHAAATNALLHALGLSQDHVVNVMMHKDVVPRAFVCDYTPVATLLRRWCASFRDHSMLQPHVAHKRLYNFVGRTAVLRPDQSCEFVGSDDLGHPHLPDTPGLFKLVEREPLEVFSLAGSFSLPRASAACAARPFAGNAASGSKHAAAFAACSTSNKQPGGLAAGFAAAGGGGTCGSGSPRTPRALRTIIRARRPAAAGGASGGAFGSSGASLSTGIGASSFASAPAPGGGHHRRVGARPGGAASGSSGGATDDDGGLHSSLLQFLNTPHPLQTLSGAAAYGAKGTISRYHNPENYIAAMHALLGRAPQQQTCQQQERGQEQAWQQQQQRGQGWQSAVWPQRLPWLRQQELAVL